MRKQQHLQQGDKVVVVSLSRGMLGEKQFAHKYDLAKKRLENEYTKDAIWKTLFQTSETLDILCSDFCSYEEDKVWWDESHMKFTVTEKLCGF